MEVVWNGVFYSLSGRAIPRGTPKADLARQFVASCARPDRQAAATAKPETSKNLAVSAGL